MDLRHQHYSQHYPQQYQHCPSSSQTLSLKATPQGLLYGYASTYNRDQVGDYILPGAFSRTINTWEEKGCYPPLCWEHQQEETIGVITHLFEEEKKGLFMAARLFLHREKGQQAFQSIHRQEKIGLSIGFTKKSWHKGGSCRFLADVDLVEISLVAHPCNQEARIVDMKNFPPPFPSFSRPLELQQWVA